MRQRRPRQFVDTLDQARSLRREPTQAEKLLWRKLRRRALGGLKFRRQHPVAAYVLDFYCGERRLGIELDGDGHATRTLEDEVRSQEIARRGIRVLRYWNTEIFENMSGVLGDIARAAGILG